MDGQEQGTPLSAAKEEARVAAQRTLLHAIDDEPEIWVFGYGSLLWKPGFEFVEKRPALLYGYHRSFCILSDYYRGTAENRGLVLGLDRGGSCQGIAFRLARDGARGILDYLWDREMITSVYDLRVMSAHTDAGPVRCRTFVANRMHEEYAGRLPQDEIVRMIRRGVGVTGSNREYLENTVGHLDALGIGDGPLHQLLRQVNDG